MPPDWGHFYLIPDYMIFIALAKEVQINGKVSVMICGKTIHTITAPASDAKKSNQYNPVDFLDVSMRD